MSEETTTTKSSGKSYLPIGVAAAAIVILGASIVTCAWNMRDTRESRRNARSAVNSELKACKAEAVLPFLEKLTAEKSFHTWFVPGSDGSASPWKFWTLRCGFITRIPYDYIAMLTENQFIRFTGDDKEKATDVARLKEMIAFSDKLVKSGLLTSQAVDSLKKRHLDGLFLVGDFDGAIAYLESNTFAKHTPAWGKGMAAKLRAHKAMKANDKKEAIKQLLVFGDFMLSDEQKDFEESDSSTGIIYSREWVAARNFMRCSKMSRELGDTAAADKYLAEAKKYFPTALKKAEEDPKSLEALKAEMKEYGIR